MRRVLLSLFLLSLPLVAVADAQSEGVRRDLSKSLKRFSLVKLDPGTAAETARRSGRISIALADRRIELSVSPRDLRSETYRSEDMTRDGIRELGSSPVTTFRGTVAGEPDSQVRLTLDGRKVEGYLISKGSMTFIEPAKHFSKSAAVGDFVLFTPADLVDRGTFTCASELVEDLREGFEFVRSSAPLNIQSLKVIRLATDADYAFVNSTGGAAQANAKILEILNAVEGLYETQIGVKLRVVFQHTWSTPDSFDAPRSPDPSRTYCGTTGGTVLCNFADYWNANYPPEQTGRDAAHLFTAKSSLVAQGLAVIGTICRKPHEAYGFSGRIDPSWNWEAGNFLVTGHEIAHNIGATHPGAGSDCGDNIMTLQISPSTPLSFCGFSIAEISGYLSTNGTCLGSFSKAKTRFDFDGDNKSETGVFRPGNGVWYLARTGDGGNSSFQFGQMGDIPVSADFDGDGKSDAAVYRDGIWYRLKSSDGTFDGIAFGNGTDIPSPADFDGDGKAEVCVYRPADGIWHMLLSSTGGYSAVRFGAESDVPMPGDFDGDGKADVTVFRPSNGVWYYLGSSDGLPFSAQFGTAGDIPLQGDFDGDGKSDMAVWRPTYSTWFIRKSSEGTFYGVGFGIPTDLPVPADYDGDGKADIAVYRPSDGIWHYLLSSTGGYSARQYGIATDVPLPR